MKGNQMQAMTGLSLPWLGVLALAALLGIAVGWFERHVKARKANDAISLASSVLVMTSGWLFCLMGYILTRWVETAIARGVDVSLAQLILAPMAVTVGMTFITSYFPWPTKPTEPK